MDAEARLGQKWVGEDVGRGAREANRKRKGKEGEQDEGKGVTWKGWN